MLLGACSKEVKKHTIQIIEKSTEEITSTEIKETLQETNTAVTTHLSQEAALLRDEKFQLLLEEEALMGARMEAAGDYFKALDYQLNIKGQNNEKLYLEAVNEFTLKVSDLFWKIKPHKLNPMNEKDKPGLSFYALGATLHERKDSSISFYDLIKKALVKDHQGEELSQHEEVLVSGVNQEIMIELLKARIDITATLALKNLTDKRDMTLTQKAKALIFRITGGRLGSIDLPETYHKSNDATKGLTQTLLKQSLETKELLESIQVTKKLEPTVKSALSEIDFDDKKNQENNKDLDQQKEAIRSMIQGLIN